MELILLAVLSNAITAALLAIAVMLVSRFRPRPQVVHWLWVVVLVKLLTPPLIQWPLPSPAIPRFAASQADATMPATPADQHLEDRQPTPGAIGPRQPMVIGQPDSVRLPSKLQGDRLPQLGMSGRMLSWMPRRGDLLVCIPWLAIAGLIWWRTWLQARHIGRLIHQCLPADPESQTRAHELAARLGMRRAPALLLSPVPISPSLWALTAKPKLVVPEILWRRLDELQRDTLLLHELVHWKRGDHWVRLLEILSLGLYWWHPVAWWPRRALHEAEEQCCDDQVVRTFADRKKAYAYALLDTVDFLAETRAIQPMGASGFIEESQLTRRIKRILGGERSIPLSWVNILCLAIVTATLIGACPRLPAPSLRFKTLDIGSLGGGSTEGVRLNEDGRVLGRSVLRPEDLVTSPQNRPFRTAPNQAIKPEDDLSLLIGDPQLRSMSMLALGLNESDQISINFSGSLMRPAESPTSIFRLDRGRLVEFPSRTEDIESLRVEAINALGQAVGSCGRKWHRDGSPNLLLPHKTYGFRTRPNQGLDLKRDDLSSLGGDRTYPHDVNRFGQVVGESATASDAHHAFRTAPNRPIDPVADDLGTLGGLISCAQAINDLGEVVGESTMPDAQSSRHAFRTAPNRPINPATDDLGTLGGRTSAALAINNRGDVVGSAETKDEKFHAFLYTAGRMIDLNDLIDLGETWYLQEARAINDLGQVLVVARSNPQIQIGPPIARTFVLTPVADLRPLVVFAFGVVVTTSSFAINWSRRGRGLT